jgi:hypothetical protein
MGNRTGGDIMSYLETMNWDKLKSDVGKGLKQGVVAVRKGAMVVKKKAGELTEEGKRQYKILSLKTKVHQGIADLGARVYSLMGERKKNPVLDSRVKDLAAQIKRHESEIALLEKTPRKAAKRRTRKVA